MMKTVLGTGLSKEVLSFLLKTHPNLTQKQAEAWMKNRFNPERWYGLMEDGQLLAGVQMESVPFVFDGKTIDVLFLRMISILPDEEHSEKDLFESLMRFALKTASLSSPLIFVSTSLEGQKVFEDLGFMRVQTRTQAFITDLAFQAPNAYSIAKWDGKTDLWPLFQAFKRLFDTSPFVSRQQFENCLKQARQSGFDVLCALDSQGAPAAMAIVKSGKKPVLGQLIYTDPAAILDLLEYAIQTYGPMLVQVSGSENMEALTGTPFEACQSLMVSMPDPSVISRWISQPVESTADFFALSNRPGWNGFGSLL